MRIKSRQNKVDSDPFSAETVVNDYKIRELCEFLNYDSSRYLLKVLNDQQAQELRRI